MKQPGRILMFLLVLSTLLISACGAVPAAGAVDPVNGGKPQADILEIAGVIESINGDQWTINGQVITVDGSVVHDGPFTVGDTVKVEASLQADGTVVVTRVETQLAVPASTDDSSLDAPETVSSPDPSVGATPDPASGGLIFDNNGSEAFGTIDSIDGNTIVIGGQTFQLANNAEIKDQIAAGSFVKVHFSRNADGSMTIGEIRLSDPAQAGDASGNSGGNDNSGNNGNHQSDDGSNHDSNDDKGGSGGGGSDDGSGHN